MPEKVEGVVTVVKAPSAAAAAAAASAADEYKTIQSNIDSNGFTIFYVPHGLVRPLFRARVEKVRGRGAGRMHARFG